MIYLFLNKQHKLFLTNCVSFVAKYSRAKDNIPLEEDMYPVIYATSVGEYTCSIDMDKYGVSLNFSYSVTNGE